MSQKEINTEVTETTEVVKETEVVENAKDKAQKSSKPAKKTKKQSKLKKWFRDLKAESKKVVWPTKHQVFNNTVIVLTTVILALVMIAGLDFVFKNISNLIINF